MDLKSAKTTCNQIAELISSQLIFNDLSTSIIRDFNELLTKFTRIPRDKAEKAIQHSWLKSRLQFCSYVFASVYVITILSLQKTQEFLEQKSERLFDQTEFGCIVEICCFLLNVKHWKYIELYSGKVCNNQWLNAKRKIFEAFLRRKINENKSSKQKSVLTKFVQQLESKSLESLLGCVFSLSVAPTTRPQTNFIDEDTDIEGRVIEKICDPPGQKSVYIPPGDTSKEAYRLSTFLRFPQNSPVAPAELAAVGYYYTGYKDRVKCFVCFISVESWSIGDDPRDSRWHRVSCALVKGQDCGNVRIGADGWLGRFSSAANGPTQTSNYPKQASFPSVKSASNNVYNGINSSSSYNNFHNSFNGAPKQPAQNSAISTNSNNIYKPPVFATITSVHHEQLLRSLDLRREHDRLMAQGIEVHNVPLPPGSKPSPRSQTYFQDPPTPNGAEQALLVQNFPCLYPVNPHMKELSARLVTFDQRWPSHKVQASTLVIAQAGFYFLGERDRVKCWYCNGGLQNWEPTDEPWKEHAKWFPTCEFLLQQKGPDFVHMVVRLFPNLRRPIIRNGFDVPPSARSSTTAAVAVIDPKVEMQREKEKVEKELNSEVVKMAQEMGFTRNSIKRVIKKKLQEGGEMYQNLADLVDQLVAPQSDSDDECMEISAVESQPKILRETTSTESTGPESSLSLEERKRELEDQRQCKICLDAVANVVFVPCGHLCTCIQCAQSLRKCPICRTKIEKAIKTYLS